MSNIFASMYEIDGVIEIDKYKSNLNIFITPFSITHFGFGYMTQAVGISYFYGLIIHTIYECVSHSDYVVKKWNEGWKGFKKDSVLNSVGDTFVFMIGMFIAKNYNNIYLFIFIFLIVFIFYSPYYQSFLTNARLEYLKTKDNTLKLKDSVLDSPMNTYNIFFFIWFFMSLITFIKLYTKYNKNLINKKFI
jgi:sterol desaturase/sphingolipid hydroxylase (fatty acid hydroxylase superfamily)